IAMHAGADFMKTSTGKIQPAATQPVTLVMLEAIRDYYYETDRRVGMKPAGGIRKAKEASNIWCWLMKHLALTGSVHGTFVLGPAPWRMTCYCRLSNSKREYTKAPFTLAATDND